jgi:integrase/recombinase XerD
MSNANIPLRVIQEVSGHRTLDELQKYLEVKPEQVLGAVSSLSMLSHVGKLAFDDNFSPPTDRQVDRSDFPSNLNS